jgi:DnaJ-class molecular chaperone
MKLECPCCKGAKEIVVVRADLDGSPEQRESCGHCAGKGSILLTTQEEVTFRKFNETPYEETP